MFDETILPKRVNKADGKDLVRTSACHFYEDVSQQEAEDFYARMKQQDDGNEAPISYGLNSTLVKENGVLRECVWKADGLYGNAIRHIIYWLQKALDVAENEAQKSYISLLIKYYESGDLDVFNKYWIQYELSSFICLKYFLK